MAVNREIIEVQVKGTGKAAKKLKTVNQRLTGMAKRAGLAAAAYFGTQGLIRGFQELVTQGGKLQQVTKAFDNMGKRLNFTSGALGKFRKAVNFTVDDITLMEKANNAMALGIIQSEDEFADLLDTAQRLGAGLGQDVGPALDSLVTGLGRQSKLMLDNLGIMVDTNGAYETYAISIGKSTSELDDNEKKIAFNNAAMAEAKRIASEMGDETETAAMKLAATRVEFQNMTADLGNALTPALTSITEKLMLAGKAAADFMREQTESETETAIRNLKEMGVDTAELELQFTRLEKNQAMKKVGESFFTIGTNQDKIVAAQKEINRLEEEKVTAATKTLDLQSRIADATQGIGDLESRLIDENIRIRGSQLTEEEKMHNVRIRALIEERDNNQEAEDFYNKRIEQLDKEIETRQEIEGFKIREIALEEQLNVTKKDGEPSSDAEDPTQAELDRTKKLAAFQEKVDTARVKNKGKINKAILEQFNIEREEDIKDALRSAYKIAQEAYAWGASKGGPIFGAVSGATGLAAGLAYAKQVSGFATGADYVTSGPELIMVGDNPSGEERVQVTPLNGDPNEFGPQGGMTINIQGSVIGTEEFTEDVLIPQIKEGLRLGGSIGSN